jgi:hypothetical protein
MNLDDQDRQRLRVGHDALFVGAGFPRPSRLIHGRWAGKPIDSD